LPALVLASSPSTPCTALRQYDLARLRRDGRGGRRDRCGDTNLILEPITLLKAIELGPRGRPKKDEEKGDNVTLKERGNSRAYILARLRRVEAAAHTGGFSALDAVLPRDHVEDVVARLAREARRVTPHRRPQTGLLGFLAQDTSAEGRKSRS
jgi:hypothetical protein